MKTTRYLLVFISVFTLSLSSTWAQQTEDQDTQGDVDRAATLPPPASDDDPLPPVASPVQAETIVRQAGIGGEVAYGRAGVLELGGAAGLTAASGFTALSVNPSVGWFFTDNTQISAIMGIQYMSTDRDDATAFSLVIEPSYHIPFSSSMFGFLGLGIGAAYIDDIDAGFGFAIAPRLGANILVGRSGILTPALSYQYNTHDTVMTDTGTSLAAVSTALMANIGYTVMW